MNTIFILPISGVDFVRYIANYSVISEIGVKPNLIICASGGCIASYVAMMSNFSSTVENWKFNSGMFIKKSSPISPRILTFSLQGYLYHRENITDFITKEFAFQKIQDVEIISGCFDHIHGNNQITLETNYPESRSFMNNSNLINPVGASSLVRIRYSREKTDESNRDYLKEILQNSIESIYKTSNIPIMMKPFGEKESIDFGIISPSPRNFIRLRNKKIFYFSPVNIGNIKRNSLYSDCFKNMIISDIANIESQYSSKTTLNTITDVKNFYDTHEDFCVVFFNDCQTNLEIDSFDSNEFYQNMLECKKSLKFLAYYN